MAVGGDQRQQQAEIEVKRATTAMALATLVLTALVAMACSSQTTTDAADGASDQAVEEEIEAVGESSTSTTTAPDTTAAPTTEAPEPEPVVVDASFSTGVQPILEQSCASCHAPDQAGSAHFELATAADAQEWSDLLFDLTHTGAMPPWPASDLSLPFVGDPRLSEDQLASIAAWVDDGAELDVDPATPIVSSRAPSFIAEENRDIVMTPSTGPFTGTPERRDDYRCLIYDPGNTETEWVLASHFEADQTEVVHHAIITMASADLRETADWIDESQPGPGWTCYGGSGLDSAGQGTVVRAGGWAPGGPVNRRPDGYALKMEPGDFFVVQIHYHYDGDIPADNSRFVLDLASDDEVAAAGGSFKPLTNVRYLGPAEIPCVEGDTHELCDRDAALANVVERFGDFVGLYPDFMLRQCNKTAADFAHMTDGTATSTCDLPVRNPGKITSVTGHMHELGSSIRLTLNPDTPDETILLDIPDWDFEWQFGYRPVDDIVIEQGDIIRVDCAWGRDRAPYEPVGYVLWSDGTGDEMCFSSITTAPDES